MRKLSQKYLGGESTPNTALGIQIKIYVSKL